MTLLNECEETMPQDQQFYTVVHPLDDQAEAKVDVESLGPMQMTATVRVCLFALRGYLLLMFGLLAFRVLQLANVSRP